MFEIEFKVFDSMSSRSPLARFVYGVCVIMGSTLLFLVLFAATVEIVTAPTATNWTISIGVSTAVFSACHVLWELRTGGHATVARWVMFLIAVAAFGCEVWSTIADPTARLVFLLMLGCATGQLLIARSIVALRKN